MQAVLKLYRDHLNTLERRKVEEVSESTSHVRITRKRYNFKQNHTLKTPSTNYSAQPDIKLEPLPPEPTSPPLKDNTDKSTEYLQFKLPSILKKEQRKPPTHKFKKVVWAIVFIQRLTQSLQNTLLLKKKNTEKCCKNLVSCIDRIVRGYYQKILEKQLTNYIKILQQSLQMPHLTLETDILNNLTEIAQKLASSTLTKELLQFLVLTSTNQAFFPVDYLSAMEITRLDFSLKYGCIVGVTAQQTRMLVGLGLGIKIFCLYVLYQPWRLAVASETIRVRWKELTEVINRFGSIFYYLILDEFCFKLKQIKPLTKHLLNKIGIQPISKLDPFGLGAADWSPKHLIANQNKKFFFLLEAKYPEKIKAIKQNIYRWISRIAYICLKQSNKNQKQQDRTMDYRNFVGINLSVNSSTRPYRSVQLQKGTSIGRSVKKRYPQPSFPATIQ